MASAIELIATAFGGGVLTLIGQEGLRYIRRPRLTISFEDKAEYLSRTPIHWPKVFDDPASGTVELEAIYLRVKVLNVGKSTARSCRAYITHVERENFDGSTEKIEAQDSIPIPWSLRGERSLEPFDLPGRINQFADVCFTISRDHPHKLFPAAPMFPLRFRRSWDKPGRFRLEITVTADGISSVSKTIKFEWQGPWDTLRFLD